MKNLNEEEAFPLDRNCHVIGNHKETGIWAIEKAPGVLTHPNNKNTGKGSRKQRTLLRADYDLDEETYIWEDRLGNPCKVYLVHRLDSATSGVILICTNAEVSSVLKKAFQQQKVAKTYHAIVRTNGPLKSTHWHDKLFEVKEKGKVRVRWGNRGIDSVTDVKLLQAVPNSPFSLLRLKPRTGRTHQLRVQCAKRGMPILGDRTYGDFGLNRTVAQNSKSNLLYLHATEISLTIELPHNVDTTLTFESSLPRYFRNLLSSN